MDKTENVLIERPTECPLRKYNNGHVNMKDKFYCQLIKRFGTCHCPSSTEFPDACQLADQNITIMRGR